jgi:hypothetical protein
MITDLDIDLMVLKRELARERGDMILADQIRQELSHIREGMYYVHLLDMSDGTTYWHWSTRKPK